MSQQTCRLLTQLAFLRLAPALHVSVLPRHSHELLKKDFAAVCIIAAGIRGCKSFFLLLTREGSAVWDFGHKYPVDLRFVLDVGGNLRLN